MWCRCARLREIPADKTLSQPTPKRRKFTINISLPRTALIWMVLNAEEYRKVEKAVKLALETGKKPS
jgi:hypothetical protein